MNRRGISLLELVGALVILGILVTLSSIIINFYVQANQRIALSSQANYEGNLAVRTLEDYFRDLEPTTYSTCSGVGCYQFYQEFSYELNPLTEEVELVVFETPAAIKLQLLASVLYIDDEPYDFGPFTLNSESAISVTQITGINNIEIILILEAENRMLFEFLFSYSFEEQVIPSA